MLEVIPAIDLLDGKCVRLYRGDYDRADVYGDNPVEMARRWTDAGATRLHVVDLDGAKHGHPVNQEAIAAIARSVEVPVQVGGGLRTRDSVAAVLDLGIDRAIVGTVAIERPDWVSQWCGEFRDRVAVGIDAREGKVATRGWLETSEVLATALAREAASWGAAAIIYTDIYRDGTLSGPNREALRELASAVDVPVVASGGIGSLSDLLSLLSLVPVGVTGAIVGRALYAGDLALEEAIRAVGQGRWQDIPPDLGSSVRA